jgi:hypothetical protein
MPSLRDDQRNLSLDGLLDTGGGDRGTALASAFIIRQLQGQAYGTKMPEAVAPVSLMASSTLAKTGRPRWVVPAFLGFVPPTTFVPVLARQFTSTKYPPAVRMGAYRTRSPAARGNWRCVSMLHLRRPGRARLRSLLSSEALEQDLCVAVDAQVLDGLGVLRRAGRVLPGRSLGERRAHGLSEGLHDE